MKYTFIKKFTIECEIEVNANTLVDAREIAKSSVWCRTIVSNDPSIVYSDEHKGTIQAVEVIESPMLLSEGNVRLKNYKDFKNDK